MYIHCICVRYIWWNKIIKRTAISSSSHRSKWASIAWSANFGKYLKNLAINCDANRFSLGDPFTAVRISKYSFSCCNIQTKTLGTVIFTLFPSNYLCTISCHFYDESQPLINLGGWLNFRKYSKYEVENMNFFLVRKCVKSWEAQLTKRGYFDITKVGTLPRPIYLWHQPKCRNFYTIFQYCPYSW